MRHWIKINEKAKINVVFLAIAGLGTLWGLRKLSRRKSRFSFSGKSVLVTGGSRGLGLVISRQLADEGARLVLIAKDEEDLNRAAEELTARGAEVISIPCDIRDRSQVDQAMNRVVSEFGKLDIVINNAGIIQFGPFLNMGLEDFREAMDVHFWGPLYIILAALDLMRQYGAGRIVNISSVGGQAAVPHLAPYTASKFALTGLSDSARAELAKEDIYITTVSPGLMRTGSHVNAKFKGRHQQEYAWFSIFGALPFTSIHVEKAARQIIEACRYRQPSLVITPQARILTLFYNFFPQLFAVISRWVNRVLPREEKTGGDQIKTGWESQSKWSPSILTVLADRAAIENNQVRGKRTNLVNYRIPIIIMGGKDESGDL